MKGNDGDVKLKVEGHDQTCTWAWKDVKWRNVIVLTLLHLAAFYSFIDLPSRGQTYVLQLFILIFSTLGVTAGAHRLFTHKSYDANLALKYLLIFLQTVSAQEPMLNWVRDHRVHHKYTDSNADPYNAQRGFFFSHMGWLMLRKHSDVLKKGSKIDMTDLDGDKALLFQKKFFLPLAIVLSFLLPSLLPYFWWNENLIASTTFNIGRYLLVNHGIWCINSFAHYHGMKPYDRVSTSTDSFIFGFFGFGEGWHNFHHAFPFDYKTGEHHNYFINFTLIFIDFFALIGFATNMKTASPEMIRKRILRTGDESHPYSKEAKKKDSLNVREGYQSSDVWGTS